MQHHAHAPRTAVPPPHLRGGHPMAAMHPNTGGGPPPLMPPMSMGPLPHGPQAAQQPPPTSVNMAPLQPAAHLREHHSQRGKNHQHPQAMHATAQMQKLRQQHQHLSHHNNNNNNNNISHNKNNLAQQTYNHINVAQAANPHLVAAAPHQAQQQRNTSHHHQPQPQQYHLPPSAANMKATALQQQHITHVMPTNNIQKQQQQHPGVQPPHNYYVNANSKPKYNNNIAVAATAVAATATTNNYIAPKSILQNPNRALKTRLSASNVPTATVAVSTTATNGLNSNTNIAAATGDVAAIESVIIAGNVTPVVSANVATTHEHEHMLQDAELSEDGNAESPTGSAAMVDIDQEDLEAVKSNNNVLPNVDTTVAKHSKEKTPMCLVNELARFNKITHQYRLTSEKGPAHCKRFTVTLKLGDEEYSAEGFKIKKAQHLAAAEALEKTKYKHPLPKTNRRSEEGGSARANITPTVELNALAMKLGQQTYYLLDPRQMATDGVAPAADGMLPPYSAPPPGALGAHMMAPPPPHHPVAAAAYMRRNGPCMPPPPPLPHGVHPRYAHRGYPPKYHQRFPLMPPPPHGAHHLPPYAAAPVTPCKITLIVGKQKFIGIGRTLQQAKHDAAARALQLLKTQATQQLNEMLNHSLEESDSKSPISLVHEIGIKRSMAVHFKVLREEGPAHMKNFITACIVGSIVTEGEGNGKKLSKKRAAEKMLEELKKLPPLTPTKSPVKRIKVKTPSKSSAASAATPHGKGLGGERRKRAGASIKEKPEGVDADAENPITKLIQLQQNRKEKEPVFELIGKNGNENARRREFIIEVTAQGMVARGTGNSKKLAKRNAAQNLLVAMGIECDSNAAECAAATTKYKATAAAVTPDNNNCKFYADANCANATPATAAAAAPTVLHAAANTLTAAAPVADVVDVPLISTSAGQVPGILILRQNKKTAAKKKEIAANTTPTATTITEAKEAVTMEPPIAAAPATETVSSLPAATNSATVASSNSTETATSNADSNTASNNTATSGSGSANGGQTSNTNSAANAHMKEQLLYLAKLLGFEVNFSDYPKGNHSEFLTIVTLSSNPPQICHGVGTSSEESQNDAARNALKILSELGLNSAKK